MSIKQRYGQKGKKMLRRMGKEDTNAMLESKSIPGKGYRRLHKMLFNKSIKHGIKTVSAVHHFQ